MEINSCKKKNVYHNSATIKVSFCIRARPDFEPSDYMPSLHLACDDLTMPMVSRAS